MPEFKQFRLPDAGEGLTEAEILRWLVKPGDEVHDGQPIVEIETAKAAVELPCPYDGLVTELHVAEGGTVDVGAPIITVDVDPSGLGSTRVPDIGVPKEGEPVEPGMIGGPAPGGRTSVLVGYGPRSASVTRRPRRENGNGTPVPSAQPSFTGLAARPTVEPATGAVLAKPPVRKYAKDHGVDLTVVTPTGPHGTITRADVDAAQAEPSSTGPSLAGAAGTPSFGPDREQRIPVRGVRMHTAAAVVASAFTAPHVTEFITVDVTRTMELRARVAGWPEFAGVKVSPLLFVAKALLLAVRRHPMINSSWDEANGEIVVKEYVNLGIAAATPRGLVVPNIKDAGRLSLRELAGALGELTQVARAGRTSPADMAGGTITITNVGVFGVDTGTPILNPGEAAILAFGVVRPMPWVVDGVVVPRQVTQLSLSFDHRIVDGQLGSRFLADVAAVLHEPELGLVW
ncbi:MAG TPA: dihydrolipoamide acetyltransferase family protein [Mycobacteriales bacterium]|nr:dihydrolipoamide acetyltransferase family protein [Mycobacteriales bacterium]